MVEQRDHLPNSSIKKIFGLITKSSYWFIHLSFLTIAIFLTIFLVYFFKSNIYKPPIDDFDPILKIMQQEGLINPYGSDADSAYSYTLWLDKYFPYLPFWYPQQGAGISFTAGYQWLAHYTVIIIHRLTNLDIGTSMTLARDGSFLLSAIGIIFICYCRLTYPKQKPIRLLIGLLAVYFYLVSPISRYWSDKWGFFAESISYMFVAPAIIFIDWFIDLSFKQDTTWRKRIALLGGALFFGLAFHTHFMAGIGIALVYGVLLAVKTITHLITIRFEALKIAGVATLSLAICVLIIFGWRFFTFREYGIEVAKGGLGVNLIQIGTELKNITKFDFPAGNYPTVKQVMNQESFDILDPRSVFSGYSAPPYVWFLVGVGLLLGWIRSRKIFAFALLSVWALICYSPAEQGILFYPITFFAKLLSIGMFFGPRPAWVVGRLLVPITAAYGAYMLIDILLIGIDILAKKAGKYISFPWQNIVRPTIVIPSFLIITIFTIYSFDYKNQFGPFRTVDLYHISKEYNSQKPAELYISYKKIDLKNIWGVTTPPPNPWAQLLPSNWPPLDTKTNPFDKFSIDSSLAHIPDDPLYTRFDISGLSGSLVRKAPLLTDVSTTQAYIGSMTLFSGLQNFQTAVMYVDYPIYQKNNILSELASWFGYQYVLATTSSGAVKDMYDSNPEWQKLDNSDWYQYKNHQGLVTWSTKPKVLFIGNEDKFFYDQFFKVATIGVLPYHDALLFAGNTNIDSYSDADLKNFDLIILNGYSYKNQASAFETIDKYVEQGGSVFIDTGWQYNVPDWQAEKLPQSFPTNKLIWKDLPISSQMILDQTESIDYIPDNYNLGDISIKGARWGASVAQDVRKNAQVILQTNGSPLIMSHRFGQGKVIWSGMNIFAHSEGNHHENQDEIDLMHATLSWLIKKNPPFEEKNLDVSVRRTHPDKLIFTLNEDSSLPTTLYWRESYHPKWHAQLISPDKKKQDILVQRAGPRFIGLVLPKIQKGSTIVLEIQPTFNEILVMLATFIGLILLILHIFNITGRIAKYIFSKTKRKIKKIQETNPEVIKESRRNEIKNEHDNANELEE